jgi:hypothetical protein
MCRLCVLVDLGLPLDISRIISDLVRSDFEHARARLSPLITRQQLIRSHIPKCCWTLHDVYAINVLFLNWVPMGLAGSRESFRNLFYYMYLDSASASAVEWSDKEADLNGLTPADMAEYHRVLFGPPPH